MPVLHNRPRSRFTRHNAFSGRRVPRACRDAILSGAIRSRLVGALLHGARIPPGPNGGQGEGSQGRTRLWAGSRGGRRGRGGG